MKIAKKMMLAASAFALTMAVAAVPAFAETLTSQVPWNVTFTSAGQMESNFQSDDISQLVEDIQPGDTAEIQVTLTNENSQATNWYMTNKILRSLEDTVESAKEGAYSYNLSYVGPNGQTDTFFDSDRVGGTNSSGEDQGLKEVDSATGEYFLLGTLNRGQSGKVMLSVSLEGETQGNAYQQSLADLSMDFAVELADTGGQRNTTNLGGRLQQTGDMFLYNLPLFIGIAAVGIVVLVIAIIGRRKAKKDEEGVS